MRIKIGTPIKGEGPTTREEESWKEAKAGCFLISFGLAIISIIALCLL